MQCDILYCILLCIILLSLRSYHILLKCLVFSIIHQLPLSKYPLVIHVIYSIVCVYACVYVCMCVCVLGEKRTKALFNGALKIIS